MHGQEVAVCKKKKSFYIGTKVQLLWRMLSMFKLGNEYI